MELFRVAVYTGNTSNAHTLTSRAYSAVHFAVHSTLLLVEFLINLTFRLHRTFFWSFYPLAAGLLLGGMLIVIGCCRPLRESLHKKFFL